VFFGLWPDVAIGLCDKTYKERITEMAQTSTHRRKISTSILPDKVLSDRFLALLKVNTEILLDLLEEQRRIYEMMAGSGFLEPDDDEPPTQDVSEEE
jgi:hypothetical protein